MTKAFIDLKKKYPQELVNILYRMRFEFLLIPCLWMVFTTVVGFFGGTEQGLGKVFSFFSAWAFVLTIVWCVGRAVYEYLYHRSYKYFIENNSFVVSWGLIQKSRDVSLLTRISDVKINRSLLQRILRLADIEVFTPNDAGAGTAIPGMSIDSCLGIQKVLLQHIDNEEVDPEELSEVVKNI